MKKQIAILGSTGSIGTQALQVIEEHPDQYEAYVLTANNRVDDLIAQARKFKPEAVVIANETKYQQLKDALADLPIKVYAGEEALCQIVAEAPIDMVLTAMVGYAGLKPTMNAIRARKVIALANKETLVVAGELVTEKMKSSSSKVIPVDSEHSAIYQCLVGENRESIRRLLITASGGPFRTKTVEELQHVTVSDALSHPNWSMGAKITVDSATMLNKAFEIIEAHWLFGISPDKIEAIVHPQSIVHSMVEFVDGSVKAQLGLPDMHLPIRYALGEAHRLPTSQRGLQLSDYSKLEFFAPDTEKFPMINLAYYALERGGNVACIINAANEIAVAAFLKQRIRFIDIPSIIESSLSSMPYIATPSYEDYVNTNSATRLYAESLIH